MIKKEAYLKIQEFDKKVMLYTLSNKAGCEVEIINYGATIRAIRVPDKTGKPVDIVLGFNTIDEYKKCDAYIGCTVGRTAGRIRGGSFFLDGKTINLSKNEKGKTTLHGGFQGFNSKIWNVIVYPEDPLKLTMTYNSPDGEEGYPGNLVTKVTFQLAETTNQLTILYDAEADKPCPVSLTNHSYFNLNGENSGKDVLNNEVMINSDKFLPVDEDCLPTGEMKSVTGTPMDFKVSTEIGKRIHDSTFSQFTITRGYDNPWILNKSEEPQIRASSAATGIEIAIKSTEPCVVMYTGNYLDGNMKGKAGNPYIKHYGFCLETSGVENSMNEPSFPSCIIKPGHAYKQVTNFTFSVKK